MKRTIDITLRLVDQITAPLSTAATGVSRVVGGIKGTMTALVKNFRWASLFVGMALTGMTAKILKTVSDVEQAKVAFETLLGSKAEAGNLLEWLTRLSIQTPATRSDLQGLARTFLAYDHTLEETKKAVMATVEASSALGLSETRLGAITYNLGQIATSTTVSYREFRDLQKQGVNTAKLLAGAVNDGMLKLGGYGAAAGVAGGATKTLTKAYGKANEASREWGLKFDELNGKITKQKDKFGEASTEYRRAVFNLEKYGHTVDTQKATIEKYNSAISSTGKSYTVTAKKLTTLTREQQEMILKMNEGKTIAVALEEQMLKTYGGAAMRQVKTLSGMMTNFGDVFQYVLQKAMGISIEGEVQIGGAFDKIRNATATLINFLLNNVEVISTFFNKFISGKNTLIAFAVFIGSTFIGFLWGILGPVLLIAGAIGVLTASFMNFLDKIGGVESVIPGVIKVFERLKGFIEKVSEVVKYLNIDMKILTATVLIGLIPAFTVFGKEILAGIVLPALMPMADIIYILAKAFGVWGIAVLAIGTALAIATPRIIKDLKSWGEVLTGQTSIIEETKKRWSELPSFITTALANTLVAAETGSEKAVTAIYNHFDWLNSQLEPIFITIKDKVVSTFSNVGEEIKKASEPWKTDFEGSLYGLIETLWAWESGVWKQAWTDVITRLSTEIDNETNLTAIGQAWESLFTKAWDFVMGRIWEPFKKKWNESLRDDYFASIPSDENATALSFSFESLFNKMGENLKTWWENFGKDSIETTTTSMEENIKGSMYVRLSEAFVILLLLLLAAVPTGFLMLGRKIIDAVKKGIKEKVPKVELAIKNLVESIAAKLKEIIPKAYNWGKDLITSWYNGIKAAIKALPGKMMSKAMDWIGIDEKQHGGIVSGKIGQAVPIIAHGGERVVSRTGADVNSGMGGSGGVTINISGSFNLDSSSRVNELANRISDILGRRMELAQLGAGW